MRVLTFMLSLLIAGLALLATLQYRWIDRVSDAERQQMRANLDFAARRFVEGLQSELEATVEAFAPETDAFTRYEEWKRDAAHPELIAAVYLVEPGGFVQRLDLESGALVEAEPPAGLPHERRGPPSGPFLAEALALFVIHRPPPGEMPLFGGGGGEPGPRPATLLMLDRAELAKSVLPELAQRHLASTDIAIYNGDALLYRSNPAWPDGRTPPDVEMPFVAARGRGRPGGRGMFAGPPPERLPMRLLVRRHGGGVDAAIAAARLRNLAVSFGVLLVLAATMVLLLVLLRRAHRLRVQQTEFVAAMSHELNTPVAALRSAGENLRDGIIVDRERVVRYGDTIVREASRLGELLGQVLEYAGMQARRNAPPHEPVHVASVIDEAIAQCRWLVDGTPIELATSIDDGLPPVAGDAKALTSAVQNLIANAIRYGGSGSWVGVRATRDRSGGVCITVEDRGPGIDSRDASHVFEPFYRGHNQHMTRGAGLGLSIVQRIVQEHGGRVALERRSPGAAFTIQLPAGAAHA
ncbi:MAG TPA: HAMP domain-containing sensor histidine kinase [Thermoanaerobaculia bacterium]